MLSENQKCTPQPLQRRTHTTARKTTCRHCTSSSPVKGKVETKIDPLAIQNWFLHHLHLMRRNISGPGDCPLWVIARFTNDAGPGRIGGGGILATLFHPVQKTQFAWFGPVQCFNLTNDVQFRHPLLEHFVEFAIVNVPWIGRHCRRGRRFIQCVRRHN